MRLLPTRIVEALSRRWNSRDHSLNEWQTTEHASAYLERTDRVAHRTAGEMALLEEVPDTVHRVLDLASGDGRLPDLVLRA